MHSVRNGNPGLLELMLASFLPQPKNPPHCGLTRGKTEASRATWSISIDSAASLNVQRRSAQGSGCAADAIGGVARRR